MSSTIQVRVDEGFTKESDYPYVTASEEKILEKLSAARKHSIQGKQREAKAVIYNPN